MSELHFTLDPSTTKLIQHAYSAFNARDLEGALNTMAPNVEWPNGMEGGTVQGHHGVRDYWTRQWGMIDPHVDPVKIEPDGNGRIVVNVHQVIRQLNGDLIMDRMVQHIYCLEDKLIRSMEIKEE